MESEVKQEFTINMIEKMSDRYFPIRDKNNNPSYREHQRETIIKIAKAFYMDGKKFVAVDGPVGCGKSAINYTVARIRDDAIYLTPLKMLQDQIISEGWDGVRMLKGRGSYACNFISYDNNDYRCTYSGDDFKNCQTSRGRYNFNSDSIDRVGKKIEDVHKRFSNNEFSLRLRTSFSSPEEYWNNIKEMKKFAFSEKIKYLENRGIDTSNVEYNYDLEKNIMCSMDAVHECPANSSKFLVKMSPVRVLNPDIFYLLNKTNSDFYGHNSLMIYDECQQIEDVIGRIFRAKIPIDAIYESFGIDMRHLYDIGEMSGPLSGVNDFIYKILGPLASASQTINKLGDVCSVKNYPTLNRMKSRSTMAESLIGCSEGFLSKKWLEDDRWTFSILELINYAFSDRRHEIPDEFECFNEFIDRVYSDFLEHCAKNMCDGTADIYESLIPACKRIYNDDNLNREIRSRTKEITRTEKEDGFTVANCMVSEDRVFADHISLLTKTVDSFIGNISSLSHIQGEGASVFTISKTMEPADISRKETPLHKSISNASYANKMEKGFELIPIAIGKIMNYFFYSKAKKVLLTSGTWVSPKSLFKLYGISEGNVEFIKIPSTFLPEKRKIFVIDNRSFTNFSEKDSDYGGGYVYKTEPGIRKFTRELSFIINKIRKYIKDKHDRNANIIIHCHTFDIANKIAEYIPGLDGSFLIHLQEPGSQIQNKKTGYTVWAKDKNDLIQTMKDSPNSGLTIISPSISEGVDFKDDIARAQIILKKPIPYLGDMYVKSHYMGNPEVGVERDPDFLDRVCYTTMCQQYGRVVRGIDDWGYTIIIDQSIAWAIKELAKHRRRIDELNIKYFWDGVQVNKSRSGSVVFDWIFD